MPNVRDPYEDAYDCTLELCREGFAATSQEVNRRMGYDGYSMFLRVEELEAHRNALKDYVLESAECSKQSQCY